jgi:L-threonylcarbamoyladenylate synthase
MVTLRLSAQNPSAEAIAQAADALARGGVVAYPTDTLYGLAADPRDAAAVERLFAIKGRGAASAIPLIADDVEQAARAGALGPRELALARRFWPGPLTVVVAARPGLTPALLGGGDTVAIRVPDHAVARALARAFGFCITATSANPSGRVAPASAAALDDDTRARVDVVLDAGATRGGPPSTIVEVTASGPRLIRAGAIAWERVIKSLE